MNIIGIDLGTSNSAAAVLRGGRPVIIPSAEGISIGGKAFPSYVALTADGQMLVGEPARRQAASNPEGTTSAFKRKMGKRENIRLRSKDYKILKSVHFPWPIATMILQHHEKLDGSGYPNGLIGSDIILESRIITVADVVEAIQSARPYRDAEGIEAALDEITRWSGIKYDADVAAVCRRLIVEQGFNINNNDYTKTDFINLAFMKAEKALS